MVSTWIQTDGHGRPTQTADGTELEWSPDGELLKLTAPGGAETDFSYDGFGRLVEVVSPDGEVGRYRYDAAGRRTAVRLDGAMVRRFVYGGAEFPRARVDADGDVLERYVYASYEHVPDLIVRRDGQRLRLITDAVGSVRAVIDADTGAVVQRLAYDAYGRVTQDTAPGTQPFGFKGALSDPVAQGAGLVWMGIRAYLPSIGRFTTPEPAGVAAAWNQHDALGGDPINLIDADGLMPNATDAGRFVTSVANGFSNGIAELARASQVLTNPLSLLGPDPTAPMKDAGSQLVSAIGLEKLLPCDDLANLLGEELGRFLAGGGTLRSVGWTKRGEEFIFRDGKNLKVAPWGNHGHSGSEWRPHYHLRKTNKQGQTIKGGSIKKHRPWE